MKPLNAYTFRELSDLQWALVRAKTVNELNPTMIQVPNVDFWLNEVNHAMAMPSNEYDRLENATHRVTIVEDIKI